MKTKQHLNIEYEAEDKKKKKLPSVDKCKLCTYCWDGKE